jgi:hypothetical protein
LICKNIQFPFERFEEWIDWLKTQDLANQLWKPIYQQNLERQYRTTPDGTEPKIAENVCMLVFTLSV